MDVITKTTVSQNGTVIAETTTTTSSSGVVIQTATPATEIVNANNGSAGIPNSQNNEMADKLLGQLHEQYAINNNANLGSIVTLVVAVIAVIGAYGYIFLHSTLEFSPDHSCLFYKNNGTYYFDALFISAAAVIIILAVLSYICIKQGAAQRMEQFITYAIRHKYNMVIDPKYIEEGDVKNINVGDYIFPKSYHPFYKSNERQKKLDIVQGLYGEFVRIFTILVWIIAFSLIIKPVVKWDFSWRFLIEFAVVLVVALVYHIIGNNTLDSIKNKYNKREEEYK